MSVTPRDSSMTRTPWARISALGTIHEGAEELGSLRDEAPGLKALGELSGELGV
jgi:hypothetical protein